MFSLSLIIVGALVGALVLGTVARIVSRPAPDPRETFMAEVDAITPIHVVASILSAPDVDTGLERALAFALAAGQACDAIVAAHGLNVNETETDSLEDLWNRPAYGEDNWGG